MLASLHPAWADRSHVVIGMIHLPPLAGAPMHRGETLASIRDHVLRDVGALQTGGAHGLMIENFGDVPFYPGRVPAAVVAQMTALAAEVRRASPSLPLGINVLRNDGQSALTVDRKSTRL